MMGLRGVKKSVLWLWIISYVIVLCFPLAFMQRLHAASMSVLSDKVRQLDEAALMRTQESVDRLFLSIKSLGQELLKNTHVNSLFYARKPLSPAKLEKIGKLRGDLQAKASYNAVISDIFVYFANPGIVASTKEYYGTEAGFERTLYSMYGINLDTFTQMITESGDFAVRLISDQNGASHLVVLMTNNASGSTPDMACLFSLYTDRVRQMLDVREGQQEASYLWMASADGVLAAQPELLLSDGTRHSPQTLQVPDSANPVHESLVITTVATGVLPGWTLYSAASAEISSASLRAVQRLYLLYLGACLALGLVASVLFARRNYKPIRRLEQMLHVPSGKQATGEFAALEQALAALLHKERESATQLLQSRRQLRQSALSRMLLGRVDTPQLFDALCADSGLRFSSRRFLFVGILVRDSGEFLVPEDAGQQSEGERDGVLLQFLITSVTEELLQPFADAYAFEWDDRLFCLLTPRHGEDAESFVNALCGLCAKAEQFIRERSAIRLTYYISGLYEGERDSMEGLKSAASCVRWGMEQIEGFQLGDPVLTRTQLTEKNTALHDAANVCRAKERRAQYVKAVLSGEQRRRDDLPAVLRFGSPFPPQNAFANIQFTAALLLSELVEEALTAAQIDEYKDALTALLARIRMTRDAEELEAVMHSAATTVRDMAREGRAPDTEYATYLEVQAFIQETYHDPSLSVASLSDRFSVSASYLLKLFKRHGKGGVLGCIQQARIDAAKQLLRGTELTVAQIAERVGYANALTLIRAFKRAEGVTPTGYRSAVLSLDGADHYAGHKVFLHERIDDHHRDD